MSPHPKISVEKVENGYIVRILREGYTSCFKATYDKAILIFANYDELSAFLRIWCASAQTKRPTSEVVAEFDGEHGEAP